MMVVDTSALMAILQNEDEAERFAEAITRSERVLIGAPTAFEFRLVTLRQKGASYLPRAEKVLAAAVNEVVAWDAEHARIAIEALHRFGGGPARLNYGDCMAYAVAKALGAPLLYKGDDFRQTDISAAV